MSVSLDEAVKEAIAYARADRVILHTLELRHSSFPEPARVVLSHGDILSAEPLVFGHRLRLEADAPSEAGELVTFIASQFDLTMPGQEENRLPEIKLAVSAVSGRITKLLRLAARQDEPEEIGVIYRKYFADDPDTVVHKIGNLFIADPKADFYRVEASASPVDATKIPFVTRKYNAQENPSLAR